MKDWSFMKIYDYRYHMVLKIGTQIYLLKDIISSMLDHNHSNNTTKQKILKYCKIILYENFL
jgi:hypothetical protein